MQEKIATVHGSRARCGCRIESHWERQCFVWLEHMLLHASTCVAAVSIISTVWAYKLVEQESCTGYNIFHFVPRPIQGQLESEGHEFTAMNRAGTTVILGRRGSGFLPFLGMHGHADTMLQLGRRLMYHSLFVSLSPSWGVAGVRGRSWLLPGDHVVDCL
jgi:hypothetical protein